MADAYILPDPKTIQNAAAANGNGTTYNVRGCSACLLQITGTFSATVNFEATMGLAVASATWTGIQAVKIADGTKAATATSAGIYALNTTALEFVRARVSGYASGEVTVVCRGSEGFGAGVIGITGGDPMVATGSFTGNGAADRSITTGLSSPPKCVFGFSPGIVPGPVSWFQKFNTQSGKTYDRGGAQGTALAIVGNDFTVDDDGALNLTNEVWHWVAIA